MARLQVTSSDWLEPLWDQIVWTTCAYNQSVNFFSFLFLWTDSD